MKFPAQSAISVDIIAMKHSEKIEEQWHSIIP
jgi:hypothetical protein